MLDAAAKETDPLADETIKKIFRDNELDDSLALFRKLIRNDSKVSAEEPAYVRDYFKTSAVLPSWADEKKVLKGGKVYSLYGPHCCVALLCKALPEGYSLWHIAETLFITGRLNEGRDGSLEKFKRRILETLQFLINVMEPGWLYEADKPGRITAQKIRLIHASIRMFIARSEEYQEDWPPAINQEEILMTMLTFSLLVMDGIEDFFSVKLTHDEKEAILHMWKLIAHILGLKDEYQPRDIKQAREYWEAIVERDKGGSEAGHELTMALVEYIEEIIPLRLFDWIPLALIRHFCGAEVSKRLNIYKRKNLFGRIGIHCFEALFFFSRKLIQFSGLSKWFIRRFNYRFLQTLLNHWNGHKKQYFYIPPSLKKDWGLEVPIEKS